MKTKEVLKVENVSKRFGGVVALDNVTLTVREGSVTGLIGPNGSGKTTLFNVISGFYPPDSGEVYFMGNKITGLNPNEIYNLGLIRTFQNPRLFPRLTVLENLLVAAESRGERVTSSIAKRNWIGDEAKLVKRAYEIAKSVGLEGVERSIASDVSGAHMKLIETARSLMNSPKVLLVDEPAAGISYSAAKNLFNYLLKLKEEYGITLFIIEHRIDILMNYVDYVYVLHLGKLLSEGTPEEVLSDRKVIEAYIGD
ncbi:MAG: ABC transporter ATP-binding protein [Thermoproteota archaeon]